MTSNWEQYNERIYDIKTLSNFREKGGLSTGLDDSNLIPFSFHYYAFFVNLLTEEWNLSSDDSVNYIAKFKKN